MPTRFDHPWTLSLREAIALQRALREHIVTEDRLDKVARVGGVDVGFEDAGTTTLAAVAVLSYPGLELVESAIARRPTSFPYVPGLLSFREIPAVLDALAKLSNSPDLLLCDGQGIAHPRRIGIASHLGLLLDIPSIGVGKTRLWGQHGEVPQTKGGWTPLRDGDETIGAVLRTRTGVKPLFVSPGHRVSLATAIRYVMGCVTRYKLPETTRQAHRLASGSAGLPLPPHSPD
jgi:deoxyribonuclease V